MKDFLKATFISLFIIAIIIGLIAWFNLTTLEKSSFSTVYATITEKYQAAITDAYVVSFRTPTDTISLEVNLNEYNYFNAGDKVVVEITGMRGDILTKEYYFYRISEKVEE